MSETTLPAGAGGSGSTRREVTDALQAAGELGPTEQINDVVQLSGGWSRHSYVATARLDDGGERRYILRVQAPGGLLETDLEIEYHMYDALDGESQIATPSVQHFDGGADNAFANPYMVMEFLDGVAPNTFRRRDREWLAEDWDGPRGIAEDLVDNLARVHTCPTDRFASKAVPRMDFLDVVDRWQAVYEEKRLMRDPVTEEAFAWLRTRVPSDDQTGIVHGDYRVGNTLVKEGRISAILDWELAYIGDVRFDLGYLALERLAGKHLGPVTPLMNATADEDWFMERYAERTGRPVDREVVRTFSVLGVMMLLATHYMGLSMYAGGESQDFRLAWNRFSCVGLRQDLTKLMEW